MTVLPSPRLRRHPWRRHTGNLPWPLSTISKSPVWMRPRTHMQLNKSKYDSYGQPYTSHGQPSHVEQPYYVVHAEEQCVEGPTHMTFAAFVGTAVAPTGPGGGSPFSSSLTTSATTDPVVDTVSYESSVRPTLPVGPSSAPPPNPGVGPATVPPAAAPTTPNGVDTVPFSQPLRHRSSCSRPSTSSYVQRSHHSPDLKRRITTHTRRHSGCAVEPADRRTGS
ncbi:hypothetical protein C8Q78DRAFT_349291 [Trametes maxima]|nr:hypothetical protein C8Q78DRAFT_349291 [Trametes maxima]